MSEVRRLLVAVDFSPHAERALDWGIALAGRLGARLDLLHSAWDRSARLLEHDPWIPEEVFRQGLAEDAERLASLRERAEAAGLEVRVHESSLRPAEAIVGCARRIGADLIVMGTRGRTGLAHVLLGSVAERTLRGAPCPVLAVPPPEARSEATRTSGQAGAG